MTTWELWKILEDGGTLRDSASGALVYIRETPAAGRLPAFRTLMAIYSGMPARQFPEKALFKSPQNFFEGEFRSSSLDTPAGTHFRGETGAPEEE